MIYYKKNIAPALVLIILAPLIAEVLPGATRFSSIFVFPIEMCVWGGGALLIRYAVRRWKLGWLNMLLLAIALSVAEEFLIQQTSVTPMVIKLKGITYARAFGINYVYLLWALIYESVFVVFVPVYLAELIFPKRRKDLWLRKSGVIFIILLFFIGSFLAWYSWTQIARPKVFHVPAYNPDIVKILIAVVIIAGLILLSLKLLTKNLVRITKPLALPPLWGLTIIGGLWAILLYGIAILSFGEMPFVNPTIPVCAGIILAIAALYLIPRWISNPGWQARHQFAIIFGTTSGSWIAGFLGFIGAEPKDLYFKIVVDVIAVILMIMLAIKTKEQLTPTK